MADAAQAHGENLAAAIAASLQQQQQQQPPRADGAVGDDVAAAIAASMLAQPPLLRRQTSIDAEMDRALAASLASGAVAAGALRRAESADHAAALARARSSRREEEEEETEAGGLAKAVDCPICMCELDPAAGGDDEAVLSLFNAEPVARPGDGDVCHHDLHVRCARAYLQHKIGVNQVTDHELLCPRCADLRATAGCWSGPLYNFVEMALGRSAAPDGQPWVDKFNRRAMWASMPSVVACPHPHAEACGVEVSGTGSYCMAEKRYFPHQNIANVGTHCGTCAGAGTGVEGREQRVWGAKVSKCVDPACGKLFCPSCVGLGYAEEAKLHNVDGLHDGGDAEHGRWLGGGAELTCHEFKALRDATAAAEEERREREQLLRDTGARPCPACDPPEFLVKEGGCQHVDCPRCGTGFCWDCGGGGNAHGRAVELAHAGAVYHQSACRQFRMCCAASCMALPDTHACRTGFHQRVDGCPACAAVADPARACARAPTEGALEKFRLRYEVGQRVLYYDSGAMAPLHAELARPPLGGAIPSAMAMADVANREVTKLWSGRDPWSGEWRPPQPSLRQRFEAVRHVATVMERMVAAAVGGGEPGSGPALHTVRVEATGVVKRGVPERELSHLEAAWPDCRCAQCKTCNDDDVMGR